MFIVLKTDLFYRWKLQEKVHISLHWFLHPPDNVLLWKAMPNRNQLFITFMLCYCL